MTSREQFEVWLRAQPHVLNVGVRPDGTYILHEDRVAWDAWQASREAEELELPEPFKIAKSSSGLTYFYEDEVQEAIRAAGIKVKDEAND